LKVRFSIIVFKFSESWRGAASPPSGKVMTASKTTVYAPSKSFDMNFWIKVGCRNASSTKFQP
jgi:hypothetical protein